MKWPSLMIDTGCARTSQRDPRKNPDKSFEYIDISGIDRDHKVIASTTTTLGADAPSRARKPVETGDILVSTVRPNLNAVAMVPDHLDGEIASTGFCILRPIRELLDNRYLYYFTQTPHFVSSLLTHVRGANYPAVTDGNVRGTEIPLPPPSEQRKIVELLDQADALRKRRAEADKKAERILPALFYKMFGDPATNPMRWDVARIEHAATTTSGGTPSRKHPEYYGGGIPWVKSGELYQNPITDVAETLTEEGLSLSSAKMVPAGTILVAMYGATVGQAAILGIEACTNQAICCIQPHDGVLAPEFLLAHLWLSKDRILALREGGAQPNISQAKLRRFEIILPPYDAQSAFSERFRLVADVENHRECVGRRLQGTFATMLHRAFTGDLTAAWREAHMKELLREMEIQARELGIEGVEE